MSNISKCGHNCIRVSFLFKQCLPAQVCGHSSGDPVSSSQLLHVLLLALAVWGLAAHTLLSWLGV